MSAQGLGEQSGRRYDLHGALRWSASDRRVLAATQKTDPSPSDNRGRGNRILPNWRRWPYIRAATGAGSSLAGFSHVLAVEDSGSKFAVDVGAVRGMTSRSRSFWPARYAITRASMPARSTTTRLLPSSGAVRNIALRALTPHLPFLGNSWKIDGPHASVSPGMSAPWKFIGIRASAHPRPQTWPGFSSTRATCRGRDLETDRASTSLRTRSEEWILRAASSGSSLANPYIMPGLHRLTILHRLILPTASSGSQLSVEGEYRS